MLRINAVRAKTVHPRDIALGESNWPAAVTQIQNAYQNQFELPVLLYVLVALALITGRATTTLVALSWVFVVSRLAHAFIHTTSNNVPRRFWAYCVGLAALMLMWALFAVDIIAGR